MAKNGPKYDVVTVRKDGEQQTFTDYNGNEKTSNFRKVGAVWDREGKLSLSLDMPLTQEDIDDCWFNLYLREGKKDSQHGAAKTKTAAKKPAPARKPVKPAAQDPFEGDDDLDN